MVQTTKFYDTLGVSPTATAQEIKRAYHQKALELHPDKNPDNPAAAAQMSNVNAAYEVLKDPSKRKAYDTYGDRGVQAMDNPMANVMANQLGMQALLIIGSTIALFAVICAIIFFSTLAARVDGKMDWSWGATFWGLWLWNAVIGISTIGYVVMLIKNGLDENTEPGTVRPVHFLMIIFPILWILFGALVASNLDHNWTSIWPLTFIPAFLLEIAAFIQGLPGLNPARVRQSLHQQLGIEPDGYAVWAAVIHGFFDLIERPIFWILFCLKIEAVMNVSWFVVVVSFYPPILTSLFLALAVGLQQAKAQEQHPQPGAEGQQQYTGCAICMAVFLQMCRGAVWITGVCLVCAKLDGSDITLGVAFIPWFIALVILFFVTIFTLIFSCKAADQTLDRMENEGHQQS